METSIFPIIAPTLKTQFKVGEPAKPAVVRCLTDIKTSIRILKDLYMNIAGSCQKSADTVMELDIDIAIYLTHLGSTQPANIDDFVDDVTLKKWFVSEILAVKLLCKTPKLTVLRQPTGKSKWEPQDSTSFDMAKNQLLKSWVKLRKTVNAPSLLDSLDENTRAVFERSPFHTCYCSK